MTALVKINDIEITPKEFNGQRVVTFKEIDCVHLHQEGNARKRFSQNRNHFVEGVDFFLIKPCDKGLLQMPAKRTFEIPTRGITLLTLSGYLMLVKSFTDDLAWKVQRELVNSYFQAHEIEPKKPDVAEVHTVDDYLKVATSIGVLGSIFRKNPNKEDQDIAFKAMILLMSLQMHWGKISLN